MTQKDKEHRTPTQELNIELAAQMMQKLTVNNEGRLCLRGHEDRPLEAMAVGRPGKDGYSPIKNIDYFDGKAGKDAVGRDGKRGLKGEKGEKGESITGGIGKRGEPGETIFPKMQWHGTALQVGKHQPVELRGPPGEAIVGKPGKPGRDAKGIKGDPGLSPEAVIGMVNRITELEIKVKKLESAYV